MSDLPRRIGGSSDYWLYHPSTGYDLTRSHTPRLSLTTTTSQPITICPSTTALIIIDMQNFFLNPAAGRPFNPTAHAAEKKLLDVAIPACNDSGIQVVYLTWGITVEGLEVLPPALFRGFGAVLEGNLQDVDGGRMEERFGERPTVGEDMGDVAEEGDIPVPGGRLLMRDQWNTSLHPPMQASFDSSQRLQKPDVRFHKAHISGFTSPNLPIVQFLRQKGIKSLLFSGVNTDQCVLASLQDAAAMGFDAVLLRDGSATGSPEYARQMAEFNCRKSWGFVTTCDALQAGVKNMMYQ